MRARTVLLGDERASSRAVLARVARDARPLVKDFNDAFGGANLDCLTDERVRRAVVPMIDVHDEDDFVPFADG